MPVRQGPSSTRKCVTATPETSSEPCSSDAESATVTGSVWAGGPEARSSRVVGASVSTSTVAVSSASRLPAASVDR